MPQLIELHLHKYISCAGARLAFGGKELQHHAVVNKTKLKTQKLYSAGARLAFGGKELQNHTVPKVYGAIEPTAVFVPLKEILKDQETFKTVTTEVFGPLQVSLCPLNICACPLSLPFRYAFALWMCFGCPLSLPFRMTLPAHSFFQLPIWHAFVCLCLPS